MTAVSDRTQGLALVTLLVLSLVSSVHATHVEDLETEILFNFSQSNGAHFTDELNLTGTSNVPLRNASWSVVNISGPTPTTLMSGPFLTSVQPVSNQAFAWQLIVDVRGHDCTCYVQIDIEDAQHMPSLSTLLIYLGEGLHRPVFHQEVGIDMMSTSEAQFAESDDLVIMSDTTQLSFGFVLPPTGTTIASVQADFCEAPNGVCKDAPIRIDLPFLVFEDAVHLTVNASELQLGEGVWQLDVTAKDDLLRTTGDVRAVVLYDAQPPSVSLSMAPSANESEPLHVYATVSDGYDGSKFTYTWALLSDTGERRAPLEPEVMSNEHLVFNLSDKGIYTVELSVRDRGGYVSQTSDSFTVLNIRPTAQISIDGLVVEDSGRLTIKAGGDWELNASQSFDNEGVDFLWVINDDRSVRGTSLLPSSEFSQPGMHRVELIVFDDDGETHSTVVTIEVLGNDLEQSSSMSLALLGFLVILTICYAAYRSRGAPAAELPKWTPFQNGDSGQIKHEADGLDATIQEDEARG